MKIYNYKQPDKALLTCDAEGIYVDKKVFSKLGHKYDKRAEGLLVYHHKTTRKLFKSGLKTITSYLNYFLEYYDPDLELIKLYFRVKAKYDMYQLMDTEAFIKEILQALYRDSKLRQKVHALVVDNYDMDITVCNGVEFGGGLDFNNNDAINLMRASMMVKLVLPLAIHNISTNKELGIEGRHELLGNLFREVAIRSCTDDEMNQVLLKLYNYVERKAAIHYGQNITIWVKAEALGRYTQSSIVDIILDDDILYQQLFNFEFGKNMLSLIKSIVLDALNHRVSEKNFGIDVAEIVNFDPDNMSDIDRWAQSMAKVDEFQVVYNDLAIQEYSKRFDKEFGEFNEGEISYYVNNCTRNEVIDTLLLLYFNKICGGLTQFKLLDPYTRAKLIIMAKRTLTDMGFVELPKLISANAGKQKTNIKIAAENYLNEVRASEMYTNLITNTYGSTIGILKKCPILTILEYTYSTTFYYVEYTEQNKFSTCIEFDNHILGDEILKFIDTRI